MAVSKLFVKINPNQSWKTANKIFVKINPNQAWKTVNKIWTKINPNQAWKLVYGDTTAIPEQLTRPTISGSGGAFTQINGSAGTYKTGTYLTKTTQIRYASTDLLFSEVDGEDTASTTYEASPPYSITQSDATYPGKYYYFVDRVTGTDGNYYYFYSNSLHTRVLSPLLDNFNRSNSTGGLGIQTPATNTYQSPSSFIYNLTSNGSIWGIESQKAVVAGSVGTYSIQAVELGGNTNTTTSVDFAEATGGLGISFWVTSSGSWWASGISTVLTGSEIVYNYQTTTFSTKYSWTNKRTETEYRYYKTTPTPGYKYKVGLNYTEYSWYTNRTNCNNPNAVATSSMDDCYENGVYCPSSSYQVTIPGTCDTSVSRRLGPVYTTTGQECATQQTTCTTCTDGPYTTSNANMPTTYCGTPTPNYDTTCTGGPYFSTSASAYPTNVWCNRVPTTKYTCPTNYVGPYPCVGGGGQCCDGNSGGFSVTIGATATAGYNFTLYESVRTSYTYYKNESNTCYYYWYNTASSTATRYRCYIQTLCDVSHTGTTAPAFGIACSNVVATTVNSCDTASWQETIGSLSNIPNVCDYQAATIDYCGGTLYTATTAAGTSTRCGDYWTVDTEYCDVAVTGQSSPGATCPSGYGLPYREIGTGALRCMNQMPPFNDVAATIVDPLICGSVYSEQVEGCDSEIYESSTLTGIPLVCWSEVTTKSTYSMYLKIIQSTNGSIIERGSKSLGLTTDGKVDAISGMITATSGNAVTTTAYINTGNQSLTVVGTKPTGASGTGLATIASASRGKYMDDLNISHS